MRIAIVGGGPGGLFAGALLKNGDPSREVTVFERNRASETFGFGVVFSDATLQGLDQADPVLRSALEQHGVHWDAIEVRVKGEKFLCGGNGMAAIERKSLLGLLQTRALEAGVNVSFSSPVNIRSLLGEPWDLIVAADGTNSHTREAFKEDFEPTAEVASAKFIWLGTTYPFSGLTFIHEHNEDGTFAVHGYPIGNGISTFIVETDRASWQRAGLDLFDVDQPPGPSDERSKAYLSQLFAEQIEGHPLLGNNSRWASFVTRRAARWSTWAGTTAIALLGDAAHTAHFSVGSGTKMAMEDAVALSRALDEHGNDLPGALAAYEESRKPQVERIQGSARPSLSWWEHFGLYRDKLPPWQFAYNFFTRAIPESKLALRDERFVLEAHRQWKILHGAEPLASPLEVAGVQLSTRILRLLGSRVPSASAVDVVAMNEKVVPLFEVPPRSDEPWGLWLEAPEYEHELPASFQYLSKGIESGASFVAVAQGNPVTRRLLCERARLVHGMVTVLVEDARRPAIEDLATTAILAGRTDLVGIRGETGKHGQA